MPPFFFNSPPTPEIYTLSLHDALPIFIAAFSAELNELNKIRVLLGESPFVARMLIRSLFSIFDGYAWYLDRKSTRLNSSHVSISYAVFCLKKKITAE